MFWATTTLGIIIQDMHNKKWDENGKFQSTPSRRFLSNKPPLPRKIKRVKEGPQDLRSETNHAENSFYPKQ